MQMQTPPTGLLLSIVAGCTIDQLRTSFRTDKIVRSMPNTPAMVLEGITVWTATKETPDYLLDKARTLLGSIGEQVEVAEEAYLDMATAVSGSGPAVSREVISTGLRGFRVLEKWIYELG